jgi:DNA repair exonuclease SbcCD ATPase subunit
MLIRISLIVAILGGLAVAGIDFLVLKDNITKTIADRDTFNANWHTEADAHRKFEKLAKDTQSKLDKTTQQLVATKQERDDAVAKEADAEKALASSQDNLKKTQEELDATKDKLAAWDALGIPITQARDILNSLKRVQDEEAALQTEKDIIYARAVKLQSKIDDILGTGPVDPEMPDGLRGKVLAVDPRYDFVVLDIGQKEGVVMNGKLLVNRNGKLVAKLKITEDIQNERCIANVMPGWKLSDIMEGDEVFY